MADQKQRALEAADARNGSFKNSPEDVGCFAQVNNTFLNFYVRMDHSKRDDKEKMFRSQSEGSLGSLRSVSTEDTMEAPPVRGTIQGTLDDEDGDSAGEIASGEGSPSDTVDTITSTLTSYLNDSGTEPPIPTKGKGKGPRQGPVQQKDFYTTPKKKKKGFTKETSKNSIKGTWSTGTGRPFVDELSKLVNKDQNATLLSQLELPTFDDFSADNLANTMWHCMKLCEKKKSQESVERILVPVLKVAQGKVRQFRYKYLAMALFSLAGYHEKTISENGRAAVNAFAPVLAQTYTQWLEDTKDLKSKDARQGVANVLNAVGRLSNLGDHAEKLCVAVSRALLQEDKTCATKTVVEVMQFQAKELSMAVHGMSKVFKQKKEQEKPDEVKRFAVAAFKQATEKIKDQSDQGLSNIAMAVVNLRMQTCHEGKEFLRAAAVAAMEKMKDRKEYFAGQAVANLCSAVKDFEPCEEKVWFLEVAVGYVEAHEERLSWKDLAEVMASLALHVKNCETLGLTRSETLWYFAVTVLNKAEKTNAWTEKKEKKSIQSIIDAAKKIMRSRAFGKFGPACWAFQETTYQARSNGVAET